MTWLTACCCGVSHGQPRGWLRQSGTMPKIPEPAAENAEDMLRALLSSSGQSLDERLRKILESQTHVGGKRVTKRDLPDLPDSAATTVHRVRVSLYGAKPPIWRRLELPSDMGLECLIVVNGQLSGYFLFHDSPRSDSIAFVHHLKPHHGIEKMMIISGDREQEVRYLAKNLGIDLIYANQSPEQKLNLVKEETKLAKTAYLGDGINDAPALLAATVGIAFGQRSDITAESADAVIMLNTLEKVDELLHIGQRMRKIALQSALGGIALSLIGMLVAAFGYLPPVAGAIAQEVIDLIAIGNALRIMIPPKKLSDL